MFFDEFSLENQHKILKFFRENQPLILNDILKGRGKFASEWLLVILKLSDLKWKLKPINEAINFYSGDVVFSPKGSLLIGKIAIQIELKDSIVDGFFEDGFDDFYYFPCDKYAATSLLLSEKEQVSGRKEYGMFRLFLQEDIANTLAQKLYVSFGEAEIKIIFYSNVFCPKE